MAHTTATAAAASASSSSHRDLPELSITFDSDDQPPRRLSVDSEQDEEDDESPSAYDSTAALILVNDSDEGSGNPFDFSDDENDGDELDELISPMFQVRNTAACPPLPPSLVFLYLLAPLLKLGALNIRNAQLPLKYGLPALFVSALASAFVRQIWYMLARYLRKADMTEVFVNTFARGRGKEKQRVWIRRLVKLGSFIASILLAVTHFRAAIFTLHPYLLQNLRPTVAYAILTLVSGAIVFYLSYARSLGSRRVIAATWLSLIAYLIWLSLTIYAYTHRVLETSPGWLGEGVWQGLATIVFAFCSSSTLPLYASLKSTAYPVGTGKTPRSRSFRFLSICSLIVTVFLLLPSVLFGALPNNPEESLSPLQDPPELFARQLVSHESSPPTIPALVPLSSIPMAHLPTPGFEVPPLAPMIAFFSALTLLFGLPAVLVSTPTVSIPGIRSSRINLSRILNILIVLGLTLIPPKLYPTPSEPDVALLAASPFSGILIAILLAFTISSTYLVPSFIHIAVHWFKKPLSIVVPPRTPLVQTPSAATASFNQPPMFGGEEAGPSPRGIRDELLLRKERALQRRQLKRRIIWDLGSWLVLATTTVGLGGLVAGLAGAWSS